MSSIGQLSAGAVSGATWNYRYDDTDDLLSLARFLKRSLAPTGGPNTPPADGEPFIYTQPDEGDFRRPALTIRLVASDPAALAAASWSPSYNVEHAVVITAYGRDRDETMRLAQKLRRVFDEGGYDGVPYSVPMWAIEAGVHVARRMRVLRSSLAMGLEQSDDANLWSRPLELRLRSPRLRLEKPAPIIQRVVTSVNA